MAHFLFNGFSKFFLHFLMSKKGWGKHMNRIVKSYITEFLIGDIQDAWCCLTTTIALFVYFSVPWLHLIYYIKKTNLRTVMNLFWRSWNKLHVIFYILALRQVLINLCEKTQYLHNREFFFQKEKLFRTIPVLDFSSNCCIVLWVFFWKTEILCCAPVWFNP